MRRRLLAVLLLVLALGATYVVVVDGNGKPAAPTRRAPASLPTSPDAAPAVLARPRPAGAFFIAGRIVDGLGQGVARLKVVALREEGTEQVEGTSLADGQFKVEGLAKGAYRIRVEGDAVLAAELRFVVAPGPFVTLVIVRRVRVAGVVTDGGKPVSGATVALGGTGVGAPQEKVTSADGRFQFDDLPEGTFSLAARKEGRAALLPELVRFGPGPFEEVGVALGDAARVEGSVVDAATGQGIVGTRVRLVSDAEGAGQLSVVTGERGAFAFLGVAVGSWSVDVEATAFVSPAAQSIQIEGAGTLRLDLQLSRGAAIMGQVVDASSVPVALARVAARGEDDASRRLIERARDRLGVAVQAGGSRLLPVGELGVLPGPIPYPPPPGAAVPQIVGAGLPREMPWLFTDDEGRFRIDALPPGSFVVSAEHPDFARGESARVKLLPGVELLGVRLVLLRGATVEGDVTDAGGEPVPYAELRVVSLGQTTLYAHADDRGRFRLTHQTGAIDLHVHARGLAPAVRALDLSADQEGRVVRADVQLGNAGGTIAGEIVDPGHRPISGAEVIASSKAGSGKTVTDDHGRFALAGLARGTYRLEVTHRDFPAVVLPAVETGSDALRLLLSYGGGLEGEVRDAHSRMLVEGATLEAKGKGKDLKRRLPSGSFQVTPIAAGPWTLTVSARGYATASLEREVPPGRGPHAITLHGLRIELVRGADAAGTVLSEHGERLSGATVSCGDVKTTSDKEGRFRLRGCSPGDVTIAATHPRSGAGHTVVPLRSGDELHTVEIRVNRAE
jgi:protocatechuate 3,4-dioxygenase beta subunit